MNDLLKTRTTIRKYTDKAVSDTLLNELLTKAFRASNTGNMQVYSVVVTRDDAKKEQLAPFHFNQPMVKAAPVVLTFCADFNLFSKWCKQSNAEPGYDNFLSFITASVDALLVAQTFAIAAEAEGLGLCYLGTTNYNAKGIVDALKLPNLVVPITTITLGYPDESPEQTDRLPLAANVHNETYHEHTEKEISAIFAEKEGLESMKQFVKENEKETLAQVFTDVRYTKANNEHFSKALLELIKEQGFNFPAE